MEASSALREQYFKLLGAPPEETIYSELYRKLVDEGSEAIVRSLKKFCEGRRRQTEAYRGKIRRFKIEKEEEEVDRLIIASDGGFHGVEFRSAYIPLYGAVALAVRGMSVVDEPICLAGDVAFWVDELNPGERESLLTTKIQVKVTARAMERWSPSYIVFDGTLVLNPGLYAGKERSLGYRKDFKEAVESMVYFLYHCYTSNTPIVGFVKRTRSRALCKSLGIEGMRDTTFLSPIMDVGEYTEPQLGWDDGGSMMASYREAAKGIGVPSGAIESITKIYSVYIRTGGATPFRIEIPEFCLSCLPAISTLLYLTADEYGIPFSIHEADSLTRISLPVSNLRTLMVFSMAQELMDRGELEPEDLDVIMLQHGEGWALYEEKISGGRGK